MSESSTATTSKAKVKSLTPSGRPEEEASRQKLPCGNPIKPQQPKAEAIGKGPQPNQTKQPKAAKVGVPKSQRTRKQTGNDSDDDRLFEEFNAKAEAKQKKVKSGRSKESAGPQQQQHNAQEQLEETVVAVTYKDGSRYSGLLRNGKRHGQGTYTLTNGESYTGQWKDGKYHGQGTYTFASGAVYKGEWKDDKRHGEGTLTFASKEVYKGEWKEGKYHGQGTVTFANGESYTGQWKDGKKHGQGTCTYASGAVYTGEWEDGRGHGQGTFTYPNGDIYEGGYMDDQKHGEGKLFDAQGNIIQEGKWAQGVFIVLPDEGVSSKDCSKGHARPSLDHPTDSDSSALTTAAPTAAPTPTKSSPEPEPLDAPVVQVCAGGSPPTENVHLGEPMSLSSATRKYLADADVNAAWERSQLNVVRQLWSFETQLGAVYPALLRSVQPEQLYDFLAQVSALGAPGVVEGVSKEVMLRCPSDLWHRFFALLLVRDWNETDSADWVEGRALLNSLPQGVQDHVKSAIGELRTSATPDSVSSGLFSAPIWYPLGSPSVAMHPYDIPLTPLAAVVGALHYSLAATNCPTASDMAMKMTQLYALLPHGVKASAPCTGGSEKVVVRTEECASWLQKVFDVAGLGQVTADLVQKISETTVNAHASVFGLLDTVTKEKQVSTLLHQAADLWVKKAGAAGSTDEVKIECQKEALSAFLAAATINPTNADVLSNAAHMSLQLAPAIQSKTESLRSDAKVFTEDALQLDPVHLHALQLQASLYLQNKKWVQAGTALEKLKAAAEAQFPQPTPGGAAAEPPLQQQQSARAKEIFDSYAKMEKYRQRYLKIEKEKQHQQQEPASTGGGETKPTKHDKAERK